MYDTFNDLKFETRPSLPSWKQMKMADVALFGFQFSKFDFCLWVHFFGAVKSESWRIYACFVL